MPSQSPNRLWVGQLLQRGIQLVTGNFRLFGSLAAVVYIPLFLWSLFTENPETETEILAPGVIRDMIALLLLQIVMNAAAVSATLRQLKGENTTAIDCLIVAFDRLFYILAIAAFQLFCVAFPFGVALVLMAVSPVFGTLAIIATLALAVFLMIIWWIAIPCNVAESLGVMASLERSTKLTVGHRPQVFALVVIFAIAGLLTQFVVLLIGAAAPFLAAPLSAVATAMIATVSAVVASIAYHDLSLQNNE